MDGGREGDCDLGKPRAPARRAEETLKLTAGLPMKWPRKIS